MAATSDVDTRSAQVHELLGNERRNLLIRYLSLFEENASVTVRHIARVIRGIETGTPPTQVSTGDYESAYNGLIQTHLPKLSARGLIEYDESAKEIVVTPRLQRYASISVLAQLAISV
ncbi:DUF7344 domain-containing protein [Halorussus litoreus]|uniref:DUF7344 domain-containing protein n=1 Tax=Halorussus litoreus TaxID=1710536 RepID=UPI000E24D860|nr:hypothetical protein [Halorussus litoreus]